MSKDKSKFENGLFIFRRDLRIVDNNGLNFLSEYCNNIYTIFIFTPEQVGSGNKYKSQNAVQFMIESLENLSTAIRGYGGQLYTFYGHNEKVISDCIKAWDINVVGFNLDITPYARERDDKIVKMCQKMNVFVIYDHDYYLHDPGSILNGSGEPYQKFTPYYETARKIKVQEPAKLKKLPFKSNDNRISGKISLDQALNKFVGKPNPHILVHGGRKEALKLLIKAKNINNYDATHNDLNKKTSELSASIKFGCLSIREVYKALHSKTGLIRQLYWRDFYSNVMYNFPRVLGHSLKPKYDKIKWHHNERWFKAWCDGQTGFPIIDAGMRQMNLTGYMHNRARLIVASFLVKTLLIDWRKGEQYFAETLTDYDVANNNGNWQWCASSGADSQPFFRIFNPWRQGEEYDPKCDYIKQWVPELRDVPVKDILNWETEYVNYKDIKYFKPICDYEEQRDKALKMYKNALY
jgi:deoxyribodipyrimidine photo-lyase